MKRKELESMYIKKDGIIFTPRYTFSNYNPETEEYEGLEITTTAEEVYQEWISNKQTHANTAETDSEKIARLEQAVQDLSDLVIMMSHQK